MRKNFLNIARSKSVQCLSTALMVTTSGAIAPAANSQTDLNAQLSQAVCAQNWGQAIQIVDRMRAIAPSYGGQLVLYRGRLQSLQNSNATIPNWSSQCAAATPTTSGVGNSTATGGESTLCRGLSGLSQPLCELAALQIGTDKLQSARQGAVPASPRVVSGFGRSCQRTIPTLLVAPGSAKFPETPSTVEIFRGVYVTYGKVDSQNRFGALLRGTYICVFRNTASGVEAVGVDVSSDS